MKLNKKFLVIIPLVIVGVALIRFVKTKFEPLRLSGTVEATQVIISSRLSSSIMKINISEGDIVQQGDILASFDCEDVHLGYQRANDDFERIKKLNRVGTASQEDFDKTKTYFLESEVKKSWCVIKSPINGIVTHKFREAGEFVLPGTRLFAVLNPLDYWIYFYVPHNFIHQFKPGLKVATILPESGMKFESKVVKINENAEFTPKNVQTFDERSRLVYGVKIQLKNIDSILKPGMNLDIEVKKL